MSTYSPLHRYAREGVGTFVLVGLLIFLVALFQAGRVHEWLNPGLSVRVLLPSEGLFGLREGASVEVLGTPAGEVRRIVIEPGQRIFAEARIRPAMSEFVRRDSDVFIRKRFGIAGDAYLEISRGRGDPLDEEYAVLEADVERAPTETIGELLAELREQLLPVLDDGARVMSALVGLSEGLQDPDGDLQRLLANLNRITGRIERGEGSIGRLVTRTELVDQLEGSVAKFQPVLDELRVTVSNMATLSEAVGAQAQDVPEIARRVRSVLGALESVLASLQPVLDDLGRTTPELPRIASDVSEATQSVPLLLMQAQQAMTELERLIRQMRALWLLGGGGSEQSRPGSRLPPLDVAP